jgi:hypothetical protein
VLELKSKQKVRSWVHIPENVLQIQQIQANTNKNLVQQLQVLKYQWRIRTSFY